MEQDITQLEQLLSIIDKRDISRAGYNQQIANLISPILLTAVGEMLELPFDQIECSDFDVIDSVLMITLTVIYDPSIDTSPFLGKPPPVETGAVMVQKRVRLGVPIELVFAPIDEIKAFLRDPHPTQPEPAVPKQLDAAPLTKDQVQQMLLFQHLNKGTTQ